MSNQKLFGTENHSNWHATNKRYTTVFSKQKNISKLVFFFCFSRQNVIKKSKIFFAAIGSYYQLGLFSILFDYVTCVI